MQQVRQAVARSKAVTRAHQALQFALSVRSGLARLSYELLQLS